MAINLPGNPPDSPTTGTVTLLFADIEGSTRLWETRQSAMGAGLVRHDQLDSGVPLCAYDRLPEPQHDDTRWLPFIKKMGLG